MAIGAILAAGLMFILRPAPSVSQIDQSVQGTLNVILAKLTNIERKLDSLSGRVGQVSQEVSRIYTRTGTSQERPRHAPWTH
ncbi:MAG: hypothetical protein P9M00_03005 [Candidatus Tritonobacter lacicola]|nr:hypothetical protein [Candidatus Tritonobacter lacicola]